MNEKVVVKEIKVNKVDLELAKQYFGTNDNQKVIEKVLDGFAFSLEYDEEIKQLAGKLKLEGAPDD